MSLCIENLIQDGCKVVTQGKSLKNKKLEGGEKFDKTTFKFVFNLHIAIFLSLIDAHEKIQGPVANECFKATLYSFKLGC
jgi:hypothetical protein